MLRAVQSTTPEPRAFPRPVQSTLPLQFPMLGSSQHRGGMEEALMRRSLHAAQMQWAMQAAVDLWTRDSVEGKVSAAVDDDAMEREHTELDKLALRLFSVRGCARVCV